MKMFLIATLGLIAIVGYGQTPADAEQLPSIMAPGNAQAVTATPEAMTAEPALGPTIVVDPFAPRAVIKDCRWLYTFTYCGPSTDCVCEGEGQCCGPTCVSQAVVGNLQVATRVGEKRIALHRVGRLDPQCEISAIPAVKQELMCDNRPSVRAKAAYILRKFSRQSPGLTAQFVSIDELISVILCADALTTARLIDVAENMGWRVQKSRVR